MVPTRHCILSFQHAGDHLVLVLSTFPIFDLQMVHLEMIPVISSDFVPKFDEWRLYTDEYIIAFYCIIYTV